MPKQKIVRRKRTVNIGDDRYKAQVYVSGEDRALIEKALEILGEGSISGFMASRAIKEAKRIVADHEAKKPNRA